MTEFVKPRFSVGPKGKPHAPCTAEFHAWPMRNKSGDGYVCWYHPEQAVTRDGRPMPTPERDS
jgi:hypothetical protein